MRLTLERLFDLWTFGVPFVLMAWAVLRLVRGARTRYVLAILALVSLPVVPSLVQRAAVAPMTGVAPAPAAIEITPILWLTGMLLLLGRDLAGHLRLRRARNAWSDAPREWHALLEWPAHVPLLIGAVSPVTTGLLRPRVALPCDLFEAFDEATVRRIAAHELAHARWRDPLVYALLRIVAAIVWPSPVWLLLRWVRREREAAADAAALRDARGSEESYVAALLRMSRSRFAIGIAESDLAFRARRILAPRTSRALALPVLMLGVVFATLAAPADFQVERRASARRRPQQRAEARGSTRKVVELSRGLAIPGVAQPVVVVVDRGPDVHEHVDVDRHVARAVHRADRDDQVIRIVIKDRGRS